MEYLFSYGTLQYEKVQLDTYGRILEGTDEVLEGYKVIDLEIMDKKVLELSNQKYHPIAVETQKNQDIIKGKLFKITQEELEQTDTYEVSDYRRIRVTFQSQKQGWVYVK